MVSLSDAFEIRANSQGHLHLSYYGVLMAIHRRLIRSTALPPRCLDDSLLLTVRQLALQTAQCVIGLVIALRPDQLEAFWYFSKSILPAIHRLLTSASVSIPVCPCWLIHHLTTCHLVVITRTVVLARNAQFVLVESANIEQKQRTDEIRSQSLGRRHP
jgi:hypothetical protein